MATLSWCMLVLLVIACQVHDAESELTVTSAPATVSIKENIEVGDTVVTVSSTGTDIEYTLESQEPDTTTKIFAIDGSTGVVTVEDKTDLDFQTDKGYTLVINATQKTADSPDSGTVTVTINVNKAPTFAEDRYLACVNKSSPGGIILTYFTHRGTSVKQVTATDEDEGDTLTYSITPGTIFEVASGTIKVKSDQTVGETPVSYNLTLTATDNGSPSKSGTTTVSIKVGNPCPVATSPPATIPPTVDATLPGNTTTPSFATTLTASFCLSLISVSVHLLRIW